MPTLEMFREDKAGKSYPDVSADPRIDFEAVLEFLDQPVQRQKMEEAELRDGLPALAGVARDIEALPTVRAFVSSVPVTDTHRFRRAVGVAVKIAMEQLGWTKTDRQGSLGRRSALFTTARHYDPPADLEAARIARARAGLARVREMGTDEEQASSLETLMRNLAETRAAEGRPL